MNTEEKIKRIMKRTDWLWKHWKYYFFGNWTYHKITNRKKAVKYGKNF